MDLTSGIAGLLVGAFVGLLLTVFFEDYLKDRARRLGSAARRLRVKGRLPESLIDSLRERRLLLVLDNFE